MEPLNPWWHEADEPQMLTHRIAEYRIHQFYCGPNTYTALLPSEVRYGDAMLHVLELAAQAKPKT